MAERWRVLARALGWPLEVAQSFERLEAVAEAVPDIDASKVISGTFSDARIAQSNVTQHERALEIAQGQVTGLTGALSSKSDVGHTHIIGDVTGLQDALEDKSDVGHTHNIGQVAGLTSALSDKAGLHRVAQVTNTDTSTDLNAATAPAVTAIPLTGTTVEIDAGEYAVDGSGVEVTTTGRHRIEVALDVTLGAGVTLQYQLAVDGVLTGPQWTTATRPPIFLDLTAGEVVTVTALRTGAAGTATLAAAGTSFLTIETWS